MPTAVSVAEVTEALHSQRFAAGLCKGSVPGMGQLPVSRKEAQKQKLK